MLKLTLMIHPAIIVKAVIMATFFAASPGLSRPGIATFSDADAARLVGEACGTMPRKRVHVHRNAGGGMLYLITEDHREAVIFSQGQSCNSLSSDTLDLWRSEKGEAIAQVILREEGRRLLIGDGELRGKRFDIERSGQYLVVSHGNTSWVSSMDRPYAKLHEVALDAQRIFVRKRTLLVVGDNPVTRRLEARVLRIEQSGVVEEPPMTIGDMPAGVRVLDYSEGSDDLLLGGVTATGEAAFVVFNLGSQQSSSVSAAKPGDQYGLFVADSGLRARLSGSSAGARSAPATRSEQGDTRSPGLRWPFGNKGDN